MSFSTIFSPLIRRSELYCSPVLLLGSIASGPRSMLHYAFGIKSKHAGWVILIPDFLLTGRAMLDNCFVMETLRAQFRHSHQRCSCHAPQDRSGAGQFCGSIVLYSTCWQKIGMAAHAMHFQMLTRLSSRQIADGMSFSSTTAVAFGKCHARQQRPQLEHS